MFHHHIEADHRKRAGKLLKNNELLPEEEHMPLSPFNMGQIQVLAKGSVVSEKMAKLTIARN